MVWLSCLALLLWGGRAAQAHLPPGKVYKAFQFPDHLVPVIDGDLGDWQVVDEGYFITVADLRDLVSEEGAGADLQDFSVRLMVGWNETQNKLFAAAQVKDDLHQVDRPAGSAALRIFQDDAVEIFLDADHSGGQYADFSDLSPADQLRLNGAEASHFVIAGPHPDGDFFINFSASAWYSLEEGPYTAAAYGIEGAVGGPAVMTYEFMAVPFDHLNMAADFLSFAHDLRAGQVLGFNAEFDDFDSQAEFLDAKWSLSGGQNAFKFSERFADLMLMPLEERFRATAVEERSWGRIKAAPAP